MKQSTNSISEGRFVHVGKASSEENKPVAELAEEKEDEGIASGSLHHVDRLPCVKEIEPVWLEAAMTFDSNTPTSVVVEGTCQLLDAIHRAIPDLPLGYDSSRSRTEGNRVVCAFKPKRLRGAEENLKAGLDKIKSLLSPAMQARTAVNLTKLAQ
jgi:hypothetical protein